MTNPDTSACNSDNEFTSEVGSITIRGATHIGDTTCTAGVACTLGAFTGQVLRTEDQLSFVSNVPGACGTLDLDRTKSAKDPLGQTTYDIAHGATKHLSSARTIVMTGLDLPKGGRWRICYCTHYDSSDSGSQACDSIAEFPERK